MISFGVLFGLLAVISACSAAPFSSSRTLHFLPVPGVELAVERLNIRKVSNASVDVDTTEREPAENAVFTVEASEVGYARTSSVGLTVQKGTSGVINFRFRVTAISTERLIAETETFEEGLSASEKADLSEKKKSYEGGLDIPWLQTLGINLNEGATKKDMKEAFAKVPGYNEKALVGKKIMKDLQVERIDVDGTLRATGVSFLPVTVNSYVKIARVYLEDGSFKTVLSDHPGDLTAATLSGETVPTEDGRIEIL